MTQPQSPPNSRFGLTARSPFGRASSVQPSGTTLRAQMLSGPTSSREGSVLSDRMSDMMSVDTATTSRLDRRASRMVPYAASNQSSRALTQPPDLGNHSAESILRTLESFRTPLSNSRAPVLPASRINVPIPDKNTQNVGSPYARPLRRKAANAAKAIGAIQPENSTTKPGKGKERAHSVEAEQTQKDAAMVMDEDIPEKAPVMSPKRAEPPTSMAMPEHKKTGATPETESKSVATPAQPTVPAITLPIPSGPMIPLPQVSLPTVFPPAAGVGGDTGFRVVDSYDTKGKSSLRVGKQNITRQHPAAAGGDRNRAERHGHETSRPHNRGTNVFKMPEDDDDDDIAEKPTEKTAAPTLPDPKTVAEWFKPSQNADSDKDVSVKPVIEPQDIFRDSLARLASKSTPVPPMPTLFSGASSPAPVAAPSPPTSLVFNANIGGTQPTIQFGAPKTTDTQPKPALGTGPSPFDAFFKKPPSPSTPPTDSTKAAGPPSFSFTNIKTSEPAVGDAPSARPLLGNGPSPFGAFAMPKPNESKDASAAPAPSTFPFNKLANSAFNPPATLSFGQKPVEGNTAFGANASAFKPVAVGATPPSWNAFGGAKESSKPSSETPAAPTTASSLSFGFGANRNAPSSAFAGTTGRASPFGNPLAKPSADGAQATGDAASAHVLGGSTPGGAPEPPRSTGFTFGTPSTVTSFGSSDFGKKPAAEETKGAAEGPPKPPSFGGFGSAFGTASGNANALLKTGDNSLGLTTSDAGTSKSAFSVFGSADSKPVTLFGGQPKQQAPSTPAPTNTPAETQKPNTPPAKESSPDKMETSPVRADLNANSLDTATTTPSGAPPTKSAFPSFGMTTPSTNLFGRAPSATLFGTTPTTNPLNPANKDGATPASPFSTPAASSSFSFSFGAAGSTPSNPFTGAGGGGSPFGNPFAKAPAGGAIAPGGVSPAPAFGAPTTVATPERPQSSGFSFGTPSSTTFAFGQPAQPSPFGANSAGLPAGTPPLSFGAIAQSGDGASTGLPSPGGSFNLGAADNASRKVKGLPNRRKRV
ncbi:hypothetical protein CALVIDRAFT_534493 [Calocera viscosa TUFC12733]|uniref:Uncharacterized protein n=1 Tax=Calocera viscosa (strain TUFC12733) TaxID=1330018 RepID=A0A167Q7R0_CALVF|nr:hypothetical protein CALVIDRAFT_534493 [Calocera viscosa TUFC12733]